MTYDFHTQFLKKMAFCNALYLKVICDVFAEDNGYTFKEWCFVKKRHFIKILTCALFTPTR